MEAGPLVGSAIDPDASAVCLDDLLDDCKADSRAPVTVLARTEVLEDLENPVVVGGIDSLAVVAHSDLVAVLQRLHLHPDQRLFDVSHVVEGVADQIREELVEPRAIAHQERWVLGKLERGAPRMFACHLKTSVFRASSMTSPD
jgi:hypothetical protein